MYSKVRHKANHISFRRWSHKKWAAFCSLGQVVHIGTLKKNVADRSLAKQIDNPELGMQLLDVPESEMYLDDVFDDELVLIGQQATFSTVIADLDDVDTFYVFRLKEYYMPAL